MKSVIKLIVIISIFMVIGLFAVSCNNSTNSSNIFSNTSWQSGASTITFTSATDFTMTGIGSGTYTCTGRVANMVQTFGGRLFTATISTDGDTMTVTEVGGPTYTYTKKP